MVFFAVQDGPYVEADTLRGELLVKADREIRARRLVDLPINVDALANEMHERVVDEFIGKLERRESLRTYRDDDDGPHTDTMADAAIEP
jgi:hypothetical protein